jgi:hypothetical protein
MHNGTKGDRVPTLFWSSDIMLIDALVIFVAIIAIFVLHILLRMRQLVRLGEMRRDYVRERQARLTSLREEPRG